MKWFMSLSLTVVVIGILVAFYFAGFIMNETEEINMSRTLATDGIEEITIAGELAEIYIHTHAQNEIRAEVTGNVGKKNWTTDFQAETSGKTATIHFFQKQRTPISLNLFEPVPELHVYIPDKVYETLTLETRLGNLSAKQMLSAKAIKIRADEGNVTLNGYQGEIITGTTRIGNITIQQLDATVDLKTDEGNVDISLVSELKGNNHIHARLGDVKVQFPHEPKALTVDLQANFAEVRSDFPVVPTSDPHVHVLQGTIGNPAGNSPSLTVMTESGHISLIE